MGFEPGFYLDPMGFDLDSIWTLWYSTWILFGSHGNLSGPYGIRTCAPSTSYGIRLEFYLDFTCSYEIRPGLYLDPMRFDVDSTWILWDSICILSGPPGIRLGIYLDTKGTDLDCIWIPWDSNLCYIWILWDPIWILFGWYWIRLGFYLDRMGFDMDSIWTSLDSIWILLGSHEIRFGFYLGPMGFD